MAAVGKRRCTTAAPSSTFTSKNVGKAASAVSCKETNSGVRCPTLTSINDSSSSSSVKLVNNAVASSMSSNGSRFTASFSASSPNTSSGQIYFQNEKVISRSYQG